VQTFLSPAFQSTFSGLLNQINTASAPALQSQQDSLSSRLFGQVGQFGPGFQGAFTDTLANQQAQAQQRHLQQNIGQASNIAGSLFGLGAGIRNTGGGIGTSLGAKLLTPRIDNENAGIFAGTAGDVDMDKLTSVLGSVGRTIVEALPGGKFALDAYDKRQLGKTPTGARRSVGGSLSSGDSNSTGQGDVDPGSITGSAAAGGALF
jgi:hypothetical protein